MNEDVHYDITTASFDEFITFVFDRPFVPIPHDGKGPGPWYWQAEVTYDPLRIATFYVRLFADPAFLKDCFSPEQLEQAFWAIQSGNLDCSVTEIIWDRRVPFDIRESCIRAMEQLFSRLFASTPLETSVDMWWDSFAYDWHCGNRARANGGEDHLVQDIMFETLTKILAQPSVICQAAALHGLGHLHHPETEHVIDEYLERHTDIAPELRGYALAAAKFEVQ